MRTTLLVAMMSMLLIMGVSSTVLAADDPDDDSFLASRELVGASVVTSNRASPSDYPETMIAGIKMKAAAKLPGLIIFDFDVDDDTATGTAGSLAIELPTAEGGGTPPYKTGCEGFDLMVVIALRGQTEETTLALASGCASSTAICQTRTTACTATGCETLHKWGVQCALGDDNCWDFDFNTCVPCTGEGYCCYLSDPCGTAGTKKCAMGMLKGEWAMALDLASPLGLSRGRKDLAYGWTIEGTDESISFYLPWREILEEAVEQGADFTQAYAKDNPPKYQVSLWYDNDFSDEEDYIDVGAIINLVDFLPNDDIDPDVCPKADGIFNVDSDGGDCMKLQGKYNCCLDQMAGGSTCDAGVCNGLTASGQAACEAAGCLWNPQGLPAPGQCVSAVCNGDQDFSGRVTGGDLSVLKKDLGRVTTCPCGQ